MEDFDEYYFEDEDSYEEFCPKCCSTYDQASHEPEHCKICGWDSINEEWRETEAIMKIKSDAKDKP